MTGAAPEMKRWLDRIQRKVVTDNERALAEAVQAGALALDAALEGAVTNTGYYRMLIRGGLPGRHETGNMVSKIRTNAASPERDATSTTMAFGWFAGDYEAYFREQDQGDKRPGSRGRGIPAAEALYDFDGKPGEAPPVAIATLRAAMDRTHA